MTLKNGDMIEGVVFESDSNLDEYDVFLPGFKSDSIDNLVLGQLFSNYISCRELGKSFENEHNVYGYITNVTNGKISEEVNFAVNRIKSISEVTTEFDQNSIFSKFEYLKGKTLLDGTKMDNSVDQLIGHKIIVTEYYGDLDQFNIDWSNLQKYIFNTYNCWDNEVFVSGLQLKSYILDVMGEINDNKSYHKFYLGGRVDDVSRDNPDFELEKTAMDDSRVKYLSEMKYREVKSSLIVKLKVHEAIYEGSGIWKDPYIIN